MIIRLQLVVPGEISRSKFQNITVHTCYFARGGKGTASFKVKDGEGPIKILFLDRIYEVGVVSDQIYKLNCMFSMDNQMEQGGVCEINFETSTITIEY